MNTTEHLTVAFFIIEQYGEPILVKRGFYFGFPGDCIRDGETVALCARRVVSAFGRGIDETDLFQIVGGMYDWDGHPAVFDIYATTAINSRRIARNLARPHIGKQRCFDRFVDIFMRAPHRIPRPRHLQRMVSAA